MIQSRKLLLFAPTKQQPINPNVPLIDQGIGNENVVLNAHFRYTIIVVYEDTSNYVEYITGNRVIQFLTTIVYVIAFLLR